MRLLPTKLKPVKGYSQVLHIALVALLPLLVVRAVRLPGFGVQLALSLVLLSKWRMFAVRPRFWPAIIRANAVDLMVGVSAVVFMQQSMGNSWLQLLWAVLYGAWLLGLKPRTGITMVSSQAFVGQLCGLMALFLSWSSGPLFGLIFVTALICYLSARHFFDSFDEPYSRMLSYLWAYFGAGLVWVMGHWLLFYGVVAQPIVVLTTVGYTLAALYYFDHHERLSALLRRQLLAIMSVVLMILLIFSDWGDKII